jgi:hypothetical protein
MGSIAVWTAVRIRPLFGAVMMVSASALFAGNGTVSKLVLQAGVEPPQLTALRAGGAALGLLALSGLLAPGPRRLRLTPGDLPLLMAYGLAGFFCVLFLYFVAIERLPVGIGLLLGYTAPVFVALWVRFGQRQSVRPRLWGGLVVCLIGLGLVAEVWREPQAPSLPIDPLRPRHSIPIARPLPCVKVSPRSGILSRVVSPAWKERIPYETVRWVGHRVAGCLWCRPDADRADDRGDPPRAGLEDSRGAHRADRLAGL